MRYCGVFSTPDDSVLSVVNTAELCPTNTLTSDENPVRVAEATVPFSSAANV